MRNSLYSVHIKASPLSIQPAKTDSHNTNEKKMTNQKAKLHTTDLINCFLFLILVSGIPAPNAFSEDRQVDGNIALIRQWLESTVSADISRGAPLLSEAITVHESGKTAVVSPEQRIKQIQERQ